MQCSECHTPNPPGFCFCNACGAPLAMPMVEGVAARFTWSLERRTAVLQDAITGYLQRDFHVMSRTATTARLFKPRGAKGPAAVILLFLSLFGGLGIGSHLLVSYYLHLKDQTVYLSVDEMGHLYMQIAEAQEARADPRRILALTVVLAVLSVAAIFGALLLSRMLSTVWGIR